MPRLIQAALTLLTAAVLSGCGPATDPNRVFPTDPLINPNTATEAELSAIPGMSAEAVAAVVNGRPFDTPTAMDTAIGASLSEEAKSGVYERMFVPVGLNTGAEADYKLIPSSLSPGHLAHEFDEYRPYESIQQFQDEMSKYVNDAEVTYLTRFVTLD